jgi:hypothetical protein
MFPVSCCVGLPRSLECATRMSQHLARTSGLSHVSKRAEAHASRHSCCPLTALRPQDWFLEGGVLQPLLSLASDADDTCRCASAAAAPHALKSQLLRASFGAVQEVYDMCRPLHSLACICPGACVAAVLHLPPSKAPCIVDVREHYVGMMRWTPSLLGDFRTVPNRHARPCFTNSVPGVCRARCSASFRG